MLPITSKSKERGCYTEIENKTGVNAKVRKPKARKNIQTYVSYLGTNPFIMSWFHVL